MKNRTVKARKQGTSLTLTVPAEFKVSENALFQPQLLDDGSVLYSPVTSSADLEHDRQMIEQSFDDDVLLTPADMKKRFGKYGWGKDED
ncbi:MAG TPA: toxin-antitoxin system [Limosilactobacillus coleohominis]|nr:toxin-antitoxin system [Limosilactobacillus coleohominis]